jgi:hypothetical protein
LLGRVIRPALPLKPFAVWMMGPEEKRMDVVQFLHACLDCQCKFLHNCRAIIVAERSRPEAIRRLVEIGLKAKK